MAEPFLALEGLSKRYGETTALADFNLAVGKGEFVSLLGPSGCGKTTTLRMIAGFLQPDAGTISLDSVTLSSVSFHTPPESRDIGMVFQSYAVWPHMSVRQNIELPLKVRKLPRSELARRVEDVLALCRLEQLSERAPHELSGGQLQRVALARALAYRPRLILLDEPLSNLDVALREELRREIHRVHKEAGTTFILVTHDQVEAMALSDRVAVMNGGRIEQIGAPRDIYENPKTEFVAQFVGAANLLRGRVASGGNNGSGAIFVQVGPLAVTLSHLASLRPGDAVTLAVHPEAVRVEALGANSTNESSEATVRSAFFHGRNQELVLDVQGIELRAVQVRGKNYREGERVAVSIPSELVVPIVSEQVSTT